MEELAEEQESFQYKTEACESCATLKAEFFKLDERLIDCIHERDALRETDRIRRENFEIRELSEQSKQKDNEIRTLTRKLTDSINKNAILDEEYVILHNVLKETEEVVKSQQDQLNYCHTTLKRNQNEISKLSETRIELMKKCEEFEDNDRDMQTVVQALNDNISELANERETLCNEIKTLSSHVFSKSKKIAEVKKDLKHKKKLIKKISGVANKSYDAEEGLDHGNFITPIHSDIDKFIEDEINAYYTMPHLISSSPQQDDEREHCFLQKDEVKESYYASKRNSTPLQILRSVQADKHSKLKEVYEPPSRSNAGNGSDELQTDVSKERLRRGERQPLIQSTRRKSYHGGKVLGLKEGLRHHRPRYSLYGGEKENVRPAEDLECATERDKDEKKKGVRKLSFDASKFEKIINEYGQKSETDNGVLKVAKWAYSAQRRCHQPPQVKENDVKPGFRKMRRRHSGADEKEVQAAAEDWIHRQVFTADDEVDNDKLPFSPPFAFNSNDNPTTESENQTADGVSIVSQTSSQLSYIDAEGELLRKQEMESYIIRSKNRTWQNVYVVQQGKLLHFYEDQYNRNMGTSLNCEPPMDLTHAQITVAGDYTKKKHVFRIRQPSGAQYIFQARDNPEMMFWLCSLDAVTHDRDEATAPYGANYPLHIMENTSPSSAAPGSSEKPNMWKKFLKTVTPVKKKQ
ncbi:uncharacterized protein LOC102809739 [Saccoglossus kowalevskii]